MTTETLTPDGGGPLVVPAGLIRAVTAINAWNRIGASARPWALR